MNLQSRINVGIEATGSKTTGISTSIDPVRFALQYVFADGTGANQANKVYTVSGSVAPNANTAYDLIGGLLEDAFGDSVAFAKIKAILIENTHATQAFGFETTITTIVQGGFQSMRPGGVFLLVAPDSTGIPVTAGADTITYTNVSGAATATFKMTIIGTQ